MAMSEATTHRAPPEAPPVTSVGMLGWMKENLFGSITNVILTLLSAGLIVLVLRKLITFVFVEADWRVVTQNMTLFATGLYPRPPVWRLEARQGHVAPLVAPSRLL